MARISGTSTRPSPHAVDLERGSPPGAASTVPTAARVSAPGWRDPRLWIGLVLVACSVVVGARVLAAADDTVPVWALARDLSSGDQVTGSDLVAQRVRFAEPADLERYFAAEEELPADLELLRGVGGGELLPRSAVGPAGAGGTVQVPLAVAATQVPPSVRAGSVVDVYLVPRSGGTGEAARGAGRRAPALTGVSVVDAPSAAETLGAGGERQLVLAVPTDDVAPFVGLLGSLEQPTLLVVRRS